MDKNKIKSSGLSFKTAQMEQAELPQEIVNEINRCSQTYPHPADLLKELQAKDTTIKEQAEKIEKLTGLLKEHVYNRAYDIHMGNGSNAEYSWDMGRKAVADFCKQHGI